MVDFLLFLRISPKHEKQHVGEIEPFPPVFTFFFKEIVFSGRNYLKPKNVTMEKQHNAGKFQWYLFVFTIALSFIQNTGKVLVKLMVISHDQKPHGNFQL